MRVVEIASQVECDKLCCELAVIDAAFKQLQNQNDASKTRINV